MKQYERNLLNYPFTIRIQQSHKKGASDKKRLLCEDIFTFDIETTSFFYGDDLKPFLYEPGHDPDYWSKFHAGALPYIWQFGVNDTYYYGRDINDFYKLLDDFPPDLHLRIAVHSFQFEWHFLSELHWSKVFAKTPHNPITASCSEHPNIQFYCTYSLTNRSLDDWGKYLGIPKLKGYLDYNQMRTPLTQLKAKEMKYAERDLKVMYEGIKEELKIYESVWKLPLTSTGKVRRIVKEMLMQDDDYRRYIKRLIPPDPYHYHTSRDVFEGGYTHASRTKAGVKWINKDGKHGQHVDYTSDYPFQMVARKFPCSQWAYHPARFPDPETFEDIAYKIHVTFYDIECQLQNTYIALAHCSCTDYEEDNGKLIKAKTCDCWITELDLMIIDQVYTYDKKKTKVHEVWKAGKDYLPLKYVEYVLKLFTAKTFLKDVDDKECALQKTYLNALYGMMVTALLQGDVIWNDEILEWKTNKITDKLVAEHLEKLRRWKDSRYFVNYDWGVWVCAWARWMLWNDIIIPYDKYVLYADTDSAFLNRYIDWTAYNESQNKLLEKVCAERGIDIEGTRPKNKEGKRYYLGNLTIEKEFTEFKSMGAKRYCERWKSDGKLHLTISGVNKEAVSCLHDDIDNFKDGVIFDKDEKDVEKLLHTYIDDMPDITFPDGYISHQRRGVNLRPNGYKLKLKPTYADLISNMRRGIVNEDYERHLRGEW